jgi:signal transduction histidine kinase/response regulator RpfG family c-di-GMP phosphodiesterase
MIQHSRQEKILEAKESGLEKFQESNNILKETIKELHEAKSQLELALKSKDYLLSGVSHELRNPLNSLLGNIELLSLELKDPRHQEMLGITKICGELLLTMINNLLDAGKMMSHIEISPSETDIYELIEKVWKLHVVKFKQMNVKAELIISKQLPHHIIIDSHRVMQVLLNLLSNAVKFTKKGKIQCTFEWFSEDENSPRVMLEPKSSYTSLAVHKVLSENSLGKYSNKSHGDKEFDSEEENFHENRIDLEYKYNTPVKPMSTILSSKYYVFTVDDQDIAERLINLRKKSKNKVEAKKGTLKFEVVDTGCGIAKESQAKLFQPFVQEDSTVTRKYGGTGLGLFIIKSVISKMNGKIVLNSTKNVGTDIIVTIPSEEAPVKASRMHIRSCNEMSPLKRSQKKHKVLIADDNPYNLLILSQYLQKIGLSVVECSCGKEALQKFTAVDPGYFSFLTLDIQMPEMDGISLAKAIRKLEKDENRTKVPIVFVSGNCVEEERQACLDPHGEIKAAAFIRKPVTFQTCVKFTEAIIHKPRSILIVDDDPFNSKLLCTMFTRLGIETTITHNGLEALELVKENRQQFSVILMDCEMPVMDGITATINIKKWIKTTNSPCIPIVGITGHNDRERTKACIEAGMNHVFHKPVNFTTLTDYVNKLIVQA